MQNLRNEIAGISRGTVRLADAFDEKKFNAVDEKFATADMKIDALAMKLTAILAKLP
jgi:hypothetical protein